jgi:hypothetical protein
MNLPKLATTREGTISGVFKLPWPWPRQYSETMFGTQLEDGTAILSWDQHGRLSGQLFNDGADEPLFNIISCPLIVTEPSAITFMFTWTASDLKIFVNAELIASTTSQTPVEYRVQMNRSAPAVRYDFSDENKAAVIARRYRLAGHGGRPIKRGRERSTKGAVFDALRDEIVQIGGLFELLKNGGFQHAIGLSGITRKMIAAGDPLPLVQLSAAFIELPLIIYTASGGRRVLPPEMEAPANHLVFGARPQPEMLYENPVDLDVWLDTPAGQVAGERFTHRELIKKIGDTIGAHFDLDVHPSVSALRSVRSITPSGNNVDFLIQYICQAAELARSLGLEILNAEPE